MTREKGLFILFSLTVFTIPISPFLSVRLLVITLAYTFLVKTKVPFLFCAWDNLIYLLLLALGLIQSSNIENGLRLIETSFSFLAFPIIASNLRIDKKQLNFLFSLFAIGVCMAAFIVLANALMEYPAFKAQSLVFGDRFGEILSCDATYFGYYVVFAITFGLQSLYFNEFGNKLRLIAIPIILAFLALLSVAGTTVYVSILLVFAFFILKFVTESKKSDDKIIVFGLSIFFLGSMFYVSYFDLNSFQGSNYWERFVLWDAAIKATPNLLIGVGTGDYTSVLNDYYRSHNLSQFSLSNYNAHSQFIQTLLSNGILGLVALLIMMIRPLVLSIRYQNPLGILVFFSFFIYGLTEVFLGRYQGVVFFALMHQSFIAHYHNQSKELTIKES